MTREPRPARRRVNAVLLLDKPRGLTSNGALQAVRRLFAVAKGGHTGTLDPLATGLLPICLGEATKFAQALLEADKRYVAEILLGIRTDTADAEGNVIARRPSSVTRTQAEAALASFRGDIMQIPPMHSALKRDGKPLYELARQGISVERAPRAVRIHSIEMRRFEGERLQIEVHCSKGTYIRSLADDIGEMLGCGAHLTGLRRTAIADFDVGDAVALDKLQLLDAVSRDACLLPVDSLLRGLARVELTALQTERFRHGQALALSGLPSDGVCRVYGDGHFIGVAEYRSSALLVPLRLVAES